MKDDLASLLEKKMDRRDFLRHVGVAFVAATGATAVLKTLSSFGSKPTASVGYGSAAYGGKTRASRG